MADIESLELQITSDAKGAKDGLDALITTLDTLKLKTNGGVGLTSVANQVSKMAGAAGKLNGSEGAKLESLAKGLQALSGLGNLKLSSSIANQISAMGTAVGNLNGVEFSKVEELATSLGSLETLGKSNLGSTLNQIKKLPEVMTELGKVDMNAFKTKINELTASLKPLADEMQKVANGFSAFPDKIQKFLNSTSKVPSSNKSNEKSFKDLFTKVGATIYAFKRGANAIASWVNKSNEYTESMNLFTIAMGDYAGSAMKYANDVSEVMGINTADWIRNQGLFMTLATGFGSVGDRAATMSEQLTQLGYDLSSYYNITVEEAMQKLKSGFAGELEPLRNLGYDLSQAKLEAVALSLGIDKAVSSMTQAEKAELRYYAIMTQVTQVQGDMARTLNDPANQLRVLRAQLEMTTKSLGDIFIPALKAVLPVVIAVVKVIRFLADTIASLVGGNKAKDSASGLGNLEVSAGGASDAIEEATGNAAKLRKTLLGIDELNVMSDPSSGSSSSSDMGVGGFDFELPTYDFISEAVDNQVNQIVENMKKWLGITEDINSWSDLLKTNLGNILVVVGAIGLAFLSWKIADIGVKVASFLKNGEKVSKLLETIKTVGKPAASIFLTIAGGVTLVVSAFDAFNNGINWGNLLGMLGGMGLIVGGLAISFGATGAAIGLLVGGITLLVTGITDALNGSKSLETALSIITGILAIGGGIAILVGGWIPLVVAGIAAAVAMVVMYWDEVVVWFWDAVAVVSQFFTDLWNGIVVVWNTAATWFDTYVIQPIVGFFTSLWTGISTLASDCWNAIVAFFTPAFQWFAALFGSIWQTISDVFYNIGVIASGCWLIIQTAWGIVSQWFDTYIIQPVATFFSALWTGIQNAAIAAWNGIVAVYSGISNWIYTTLIQPVGTFFSNMWNGFINGASAAWSGIKTIFSNVASFFKTTFQNAWAGVVQVFSIAGNIFVNIKDGIVTAFKAVVNGLIWGINQVVSVPFNAINTALGFIRNINILGLTPFSNLKNISVPSIPYLAQGGVVDAGQLFVAREAGAELVGNVGRKTAVMNNDQIVESVSRGVYQAVVAAMGSSRGDQVVEAKVNDKVLFEVLVSRARQETVRTGYNPLLGGA